MITAPRDLLSLHYTAFAAFGDFTAAPSAERAANAAALARQLEVLRAVAGRPVEVVCWAGTDHGAPHPDGDAHYSGCAADIRPPAGMSADALARQAQDLGFFRVVKLVNGIVHVEIPPVGASDTQADLTRVGRNGVGPRVETEGGASDVHAETPEIRFFRQRPAEGTILLAGLDGIPAQTAWQIRKVWDAVVANAPRELEGALLGLYVAVGAPDPDAYRAEGPGWWQRNIATGAALSPAQRNTAADLHAPLQWGRAGAWQMRRTVAIGLGFDLETRWATQAMTRSTTEIDEVTGENAGAQVGRFLGPFARPATAARFTAAYLTRALDAGMTRLEATGAYLEDNGFNRAEGVEIALDIKYRMQRAINTRRRAEA